MLTLHLFEAIAQRVQEVVVGSDDGAVELELDDGLCLADGSDLPLQIRQLVGIHGNLAGCRDASLRLTFCGHDKKTLCKSLKFGSLTPQPQRAGIPVAP